MIREAWVSILGLYHLDNTVLDGLKVPEGLERETVINNILMECAELEILFPDADFMKEAVRQWSAMCLPVWQHLYDTTQYEYNPIWNKDGTYKELETRDLAGQTVNDVKGYNSGDWSDSDKQDSTDTGTILRATIPWKACAGGGKRRLPRPAADRNASSISSALCTRR